MRWSFPALVAAQFGVPALLLFTGFVAVAQTPQAAAPQVAVAQSPASSTSAELRVFDPSLIDASIDPCENFYQYSCNKWFTTHPLPADEPSYGRFTELFEMNLQHLKAILEAASITSPTRPANEQKIGDEYATCMDTAAINKQGIAPLRSELARIEALKTKADLPALLAHEHAIGSDAFFAVVPSPDLEDSAQMVLAFTASGLGLPERGYYTRSDAKSLTDRKQYTDHVKRLLMLTGEPAARATKDAETVLAIETALAEASLTLVEERDPQKLNHPSDVQTFAGQLKAFSLESYLAAAQAPGAGRINITEPEFYAALDSLIAQTSLDRIKAYLRWHLVHALSDTSLPESFEHENWQFYSHVLNGAQQQQERWKRCTSRVDRELGEALGQAYVARYFSAEDKQRTLTMALAIEHAMEKDVDSLDWMSPATKVRAQEKLHGLMNKIGYPDKWRDYSTLLIVRNDTLGNAIRAHEFEHARRLSQAYKPVDRGEWDMTPPTVNAGYDPQENNVNFPAGYLQPPFFSGKEDDAANYGDMGSTIGHELTHGFDDEGRQFDASGNLKDWWSKDDEERFNDRANCVVEQYQALEPVTGVHVDGKLTLGENLADLGGLWLAWLAWQDRAHATHLDLAAKTDGYTPDQRFWISYAQQWCTQTRPEQLRTQAQSDPHAPDEFRANAVLADLPEFAKSFSCKAKQKMVSAKPCRVW